MSTLGDTKDRDEQSNIQLPPELITPVRGYVEIAISNADLETRQHAFNALNELVKRDQRLATETLRDVLLELTLNAQTTFLAENSIELLGTLFDTTPSLIDEPSARQIATIASSNPFGSTSLTAQKILRGMLQQNRLCVSDTTVDIALTGARTNQHGSDRANAVEVIKIIFEARDDLISKTRFDQLWEIYDNDDSPFVRNACMSIFANILPGRTHYATPDLFEEVAIGATLDINDHVSTRGPILNLLIDERSDLATPRVVKRLRKWIEEPELFADPDFSRKPTTRKVLSLILAKCPALENAEESFPEEARHLTTPPNANKEPPKPSIITILEIDDLITKAVTKSPKELRIEALDKLSAIVTDLPDEFTKDRINKIWDGIIANPKEDEYLRSTALDFIKKACESRAGLMADRAVALAELASTTKFDDVFVGSSARHAFTALIEHGKFLPYEEILDTVLINAARFKGQTALNAMHAAKVVVDHDAEEMKQSHFRSLAKCPVDQETPNIYEPKQAIFNKVIPLHKDWVTKDFFEDTIYGCINHPDETARTALHETAMILANLCADLATPAMTKKLITIANKNCFKDEEKAGNALSIYNKLTSNRPVLHQTRTPDRDENWAVKAARRFSKLIR